MNVKKRLLDGARMHRAIRRMAIEIVEKNRGIKDLLIVYGRNHSPDDIEATIQEITRGRCVAIAVSDDDGPEKLVTIVELKPGGDSEEE